MKNSLIKSTLLFGLCAFLFSFTRLGGESYTIHLNDKRLVQYHVYSKEATPSFSLDQSAIDGQLSVYYNECGKIGKERKLTLKDEKGAILTKWEFANSTSEQTSMNFKVKEILALKKMNSKVSLFYSSQEVSKERLLANIVLAVDLKASKK